MKNLTPPRRVCLAGGNGFIGRTLASHFLARGDEVSVLTRSPAEAEDTDDGNPSPLQIGWDGRTLGPWADEVRRCDVLVNLAGKSVDCRYTPANRRATYDSRLDSTAVLAEAIRTGGAGGADRPAVWLNASTATIYRHAEDRPQDEATGEITPDSLPPGTPDDRRDDVAPGWNEKWAFSVDVARRWEQTFFDADTGGGDEGDSNGVRKVALRMAMVFGPGAGGVFAAFDRVVRLGLGGTIWPGRQRLSWVHVDDLCRAVEFLISRDDLSGPVNVAAPTAETMADFLAAHRRARRMPVGLPATRRMIELGTWALRTESELLFKSRWVEPKRLLDAGFTFEHPAWPEAVADVVARHRSGAP